MTAFTASLSELLDSIELVMDFFVEAFVGIADMLFNSPFVFFIGLTVCMILLGVVGRFLRIGTH